MGAADASSTWAGLKESEVVWVPGLQGTDEHLECWESTQVLETGVAEEEGPAGESGADAALEPLEGDDRLLEQGESAGDLVVDVVGVTKGLRACAGLGDGPEGALGLASQSEEDALKTGDERIAGQETGCFFEQGFSGTPVSGHHGGLRSEVEGVLLAGAFGTPCLDLLTGGVIVAAPEVDLGDAVADGSLGMEWPGSLVHGAGVVEEAYVREDGAEPVVAAGEVILEGERAPKRGDSLDVLEVPGWSPEQEGPGEVSFGQIGVELKGAVAVKLRFLEPGADGIELEVACCADECEGGVGDGKAGVACDCGAEVLRCCFEQ